MRILKRFLGILLVVFGVNGLFRMGEIGDVTFTISLAASMICAGILLVVPKGHGGFARRLLLGGFGVSILGFMYVLYRNYSVEAGWPGVVMWMLAMVAVAVGVYVLMPSRLYAIPDLGEPTDLHELTCPKCGWDGWRKLRQVYETGTRETRRTVMDTVFGISGPRQVAVEVTETERTMEAMVAAPPFEFEAVRQVMAMVMLGLFMAGMDLEKANDVRFFAGMSWGFLAFFAWIVFGHLYNRTLRIPKAYRWENQAMCSRCGEVFSTFQETG